jgi:hypothetical protein
MNVMISTVLLALDCLHSACRVCLDPSSATSYFWAECAQPPVFDSNKQIDNAAFPFIVAQPSFLCGSERVPPGWNVFVVTDDPFPKYLRYHPYGISFLSITYWRGGRYIQVHPTTLISLLEIASSKKF